MSRDVTRRGSSHAVATNIFPYSKAPEELLILSFSKSIFSGDLILMSMYPHIEYISVLTDSFNLECKTVT